MSPSVRLMLAGLGAGIIGVFTSWLITGVLFHPFQRRTPATWRPGEGPLHYTAASVLTIIAAVLVAMLSGAGSPHLGGGGLIGGLAFGALCWAALTAPVLLSVGVFVNLHPAMVTGLLLDWLVVALLAGGAAGWVRS